MTDDRDTLHTEAVYVTAEFLGVDPSEVYAWQVDNMREALMLLDEMRAR